MTDHDSRPRFLPVTRVDDGVPTGLGRRAVLRAIAGGIGAGVAVPGLAGAQDHLHRRLADDQVFDRARQNAAAVGYTPELLDAQGLRTLESLAEAIVPGSTTARVAPFLDQLIAVDAAPMQRAFLGAVGAFGMAATAAHGRSWLEIDAAQQTALLEQASTATPATSLHPHFLLLKELIAGAYYSSEQGMRELGWDGTVVHGALPECTHPDGHRA
jgi:hypothetical protein